MKIIWDVKCRTVFEGVEGCAFEFVGPEGWSRLLQHSLDSGHNDFTLRMKEIDAAQAVNELTEAVRSGE
jgi:hypothetical protein